MTTMYTNSRTNPLKGLFLPLILTATAACNPTYAPPARAGLGGAPATPKKAAVDVGAATLLTLESVGASGDFGVGVNDWVQVEGGVWGMRVSGESAMVLGYAGARVNPLAALERSSKVRPTSDVEAGIGAGAGGQNCRDRSILESCVAEGVSRHAAGGGYLGGAVGFDVVDVFDLYARTRLQLAGAESVPTTFWYIAAMGMQFTIAKRLRFFLDGGFAGYVNEYDNLYGFYGELGMSVRVFDPPPRHTDKVED